MNRLYGVRATPAKLIPARYVGSDILFVDFDMPDWYTSFAAAVEQIGYFTNGIEHKEGWYRTTVSDHKQGGNSFWVAVISQSWFIGHWTGWVYRLDKPDRVLDFCSDWFFRFPGRIPSDFDDSLKAEFGLTRISEEEFDLAVASNSLLGQ